MILRSPQGTPVITGGYIRGRAGADMPEFFFHLTNGNTFQDDRAVRCRTLEEAKTLALSIAAELGRNRAAREIENLAIRVTDKTGKEVFRTKVVNLQRRTKADDISRAARANTN
jgi:hypothetical protein